MQSEKLDDDHEVKLSHAIKLPIQHIENYANTMDSLLNEYKAKDLLTEDFKKVATLEIEFKKLHKLMMENYNLNALNGMVIFAPLKHFCEVVLTADQCR